MGHSSPMGQKTCNRTMIIAEAGVNHNGDLALAKKLIEIAAEAGADFVKFQTFRAEDVASPSAPKAQYQLGQTKAQESQLSMLSKLELSPLDHQVLVEHCTQHDIGFMSSPFSEGDLSLLLEIGIRWLKIASGEITNYPLLKSAAKSGLPLILSTGMASLGDIERAVDLLLNEGLALENLTLLQCTSEYPAPFEEVNLRAMETLARSFGARVGFSDHTPGIAVATAAVALGATVIEKHFTVDKTLPGPDHKASLEPHELAAMISSIRQVELALGTSQKRVTASEAKNQAIGRKSLHLRSTLPEGSIIAGKDLQTLRPGDGISPMLWNKVVGQRLNRTAQSGHKLSWADFKPNRLE